MSCINNVFLSEYFRQQIEQKDDITRFITLDWLKGFCALRIIYSNVSMLQFGSIYFHPFIIIPQSHFICRVLA